MVQEESLNRLLGKQCKIVTKELGDKKIFLLGIGIQELTHMPTPSNF